MPKFKTAQLVVINGHCRVKVVHNIAQCIYNGKTLDLQGEIVEEDKVKKVIKQGALWRTIDDHVETNTLDLYLR